MVSNTNYVSLSFICLLTILLSSILTLNIEYYSLNSQFTVDENGYNISNIEGKKNQPWSIHGNNESAFNNVVDDYLSEE